MMKKFAVATALSLGLMAGTAQAAFVVGGENGWQLSTDGIVDVFATYDTTSNHPFASDGTLTGNRYDFGLLDVQGQRFGVGVGLLPSVVGLNIKAPTTNGVDSTVRIGIYPSIQNTTNASLANPGVLANSDRFSVGPNIDFREIYYTGKGKYGEILAGRALNLFQGKNILNDMTLLTAGTVGLRAHTVTLGHIGWGYLYPGFGPQIRYTTPDCAGLKAAVLVGEPYDISGGDKTNVPRFEAELSYAQLFGKTSVQAWASALYQTATSQAASRLGHKETSVGTAFGASVGMGGLSILGSGYYGEALGTVSAQDGAALGGLFGGSTDAFGDERTDWGFLGQVTYQINPTWKVGANYGQTRQQETAADKAARNSSTGRILVKKQESAVASITYNLNKFTQFVAEYIYAQSTWMDRATQHSNQVAVGTMFYW